MKPNNLVEMLYRTVQKFPLKNAFMWKEEGVYQHMTYGEFWNKVYHIASGFRQLGIGEDDKVAILSNSNPMWGITDFALASIGAISVPIYPTLPSGQVAYVLENADVRATVVENNEQKLKIADGDVEMEHIITMYPSGNNLLEGELSFSELEKMGE